MTEAEWLACQKPTLMLQFLLEKASDRKLRLFGCACCRRHWRLLVDERSRAAVEMAEWWSDGSATNAEQEAAESAAAQASRDAARARQASDGAVGERFTIAARAAGFLATVNAFGTDGCLTVAGCCRLIVLHESGGRDCRESENAALCSALRDIFGNPFHPATFDPEWRTDTAVALARQMYESRDFSAMPILADALQDAGCDSADVLDHCRGPAPHVRGCWVVDLVLGKE